MISDQDTVDNSDSNDAALCRVPKLPQHEHARQNPTHAPCYNRSDSTGATFGSVQKLLDHSMADKRLTSHTYLVK
jgi:hypothetical protein